MGDVIFESTVDGGKFKVSVVRTGDYTGNITVSVVENNEVLLDKEVGLMYGAVFGPDVDDLDDWQTQALTVIDEWIANNG